MANLALSTVRALLLDMDGVVYYNNGVLEGVNEFLGFLREHDIAFAFEQHAKRFANRDFVVDH